MKKRLLSLVLALTMICGLYLMKNDIALPAEAVAAGFVHNYTLTGDPATDIVRIALAQEGRTGSQMGYGTEWCAYFVADCAELAGADDVIPYTGWVPTMIDAIDGYESTNDPRPGDICFYDWNRNSSPDHVEIVYDVTSSAIYTIGGNSGSGGSYSTRSVKPHCYSRDSADILKIIRPNYSGSTPTRTIAPEYADYLPMRAYPIATGNITVYDQYGSVYSNRYITGSTDFCYIWEIYTDGWCKVEYPSTAESSGWFTAYVPFSVFASSPSPTTWTSGGQCTAYRRSDLSQAINSGYNTISKGSSCLVVKSSGNLKQVIYPVSGTTYYAMGWISAPSYTYSFDFNANGGTLGETGAFTTTYGSEFQILNTTCGRSGYTWAGWNVKRNTDNKWYVNGVGWCTESEISSNGYTKNVYSNYMTCTLDDSWINGISGDASFTFYAIWRWNCASGHSYNSGVITTAPTCTASGTKTYTCTNCGAKKTESIYPTGHSYESGVITTVPTCTLAGEKTYTCSGCGSTVLEIVAATGHNYSAATCLTPKTCTSCGATTGNVGAHNVADGICTVCNRYGTCGDNLIWEMDDDGLLTISGTGAMDNYAYDSTSSTDSAQPWKNIASSIEMVVITNGVTSIGERAFRGCTNLVGVEIPDSVTSIGSYAFYKCAALTVFEIPDSVTSVGGSAFYKCSGLKEIVIPEGVANIGTYTFYYCTSLRSVVLPNSVTVIADNAFSNCTALADVIYCGTAQQWNAISMGANNANLSNAARSYHAYDSDSDTTCNICGAVRQVGPAKDESLVFNGNPGLSFKDYIGMQLLVSNDVLSGYDSFYIKAIQTTPDGAEETTLNGTLYYGVYQKFEQPILSWSMAESVTLTIYGVKGGVTYEGATVTTSVAQLAMEKIATYYENVNLNACKALVDMLNYGTAVQTAYGRNTANLPNASLGKYSTLGTSATPSFSASNNKTGTGKVTVLNDSISMRAKVEIQLLLQGDISAYTVKALMGSTAASVVIDKTTYASYGWTIVKVAVSADKLRDNLTVALYDSNGNPVTQVYNVSVEAYAKTQLGGTYNDVVIAMMRYGDSVAAL